MLRAVAGDIFVSSLAHVDEPRAGAGLHLQGGVQPATVGRQGKKAGKRGSIKTGK